MLWIGDYNGTGSAATRPHDFRIEDNVPDRCDPRRGGVGPNTNITFNALQHAHVDFYQAEFSQLGVSVTGGDDAWTFANGQLIYAHHDHCGHRQTLRTYEGAVSKAVPATGPYRVELVAGDEDTATIPPCLELDVGDVIDMGYERPAVASCRVEMPVGTSTDRLPCAAGAFAYVDEYFEHNGLTEHTVDLSLLDVSCGATACVNVTYEFVAPLCVAEIATTAHDDGLKGFVAREGSREVALDAVEDMLLEAPVPIQGPEIYGTACVNSSGAVFVEEDRFDVAFSLVETYPDNSVNSFLWPWQFRTSVPCAEGADEAWCPDEYATYETAKPAVGHDVGVKIFDGLSRITAVDEEYDVKADFGYTHTVTAGDPNPFAPFTLTFNVEFYRGTDQSEILVDRRAIVLGVLPEDVPQTFVMTTDPTLVYSVLRDPPGGHSYASIVQGSTLSQSMSINGMHAATTSRKDSDEGFDEYDLDLNTELAPWGFGVTGLGAMSAHLAHGTSEAHTRPAVAVDRGSSQHFDLTFSFNVGISTSTDPTIAGQPSDLILGGGANLRVLTAVEVQLDAVTRSGLAEYEAGDELCVMGNTTYEWLPTQITTYLLSVFEIETTMMRLGALSDQTTATHLAITNWQTVLANYREATTSNVETLRAGIHELVDGLLAQFAQFSSNSDNSEEWRDFLAQGVVELQGVATAAAGDVGNTLSEITEQYEDDEDDKDDQTLFVNELIQDTYGVETNDLYDLADILWGVLKTTDGNCQAGDNFGVGRLCETIDDIAEAVKVSHETVMGLCSFVADSNEASMAHMAPVVNFCQSRDDASLPSQAFDFLSDSSHLYTSSAVLVHRRLRRRLRGYVTSSRAYGAYVGAACDEAT